MARPAEKPVHVQDAEVAGSHSNAGVQIAD